MNTVEQTQTQDIPLKKLLAWKENVRTTNPDQSIDELAASIDSLGLLQSLVVRKATRGKFAVVAGKRRLQALSQLARTGSITPDFQVPCRLVNDGADLTEISLAENVQREPMHPADEFEAFQKLINDHGKSIADGAARFGVSEAVVNRRLALARVSPVLLDRYRSGEMNLSLLQAFTLTGDHQLQEQVWDRLQQWNRNPDAVRRMLSTDDIPAGDKRVRFVGLANYEAQGGLVKRDLFAQEDDEDGVYVADPAKLLRLADERLRQIADQVKAEGWQWVEIQPELDHAAINRHVRVRPNQVPLTEEAENTLARFCRERDEIQEQLEGGSGDDSADADEETLSARQYAIEAQITALERTALVYPPEVKATCGVVVSIGHEGSPKLSCGLLRKQDEAAFRELKSEDSSSPHPNPVPAQKNEAPDGPFYSAATVDAGGAAAREGISDGAGGR